MANWISALSSPVFLAISAITSALVIDLWIKIYAM